MRRARKFLALGRRERTLLFYSAATVLGVRLALWCTPSRFVLRRVTSYVARAARRPQAAIPPRTMGWAVRAVSRLVPRASCLTQALAAQIVLAKYGYDSRLRLGVARSRRGKFRAHAWVESEGEIIVGASEISQLTVLPDLGKAL